MRELPPASLVRILLWYSAAVKWWVLSGGGAAYLDGQQCYKLSQHSVAFTSCTRTLRTYFQNIGLNAIEAAATFELRQLRVHVKA
jgi:hypothetical protein